MKKLMFFIVCSLFLVSCNTETIKVERAGVLESPANFQVKQPFDVKGDKQVGIFVEVYKYGQL